LERAVNRLIMMVILFVAALGIANSILMNIMERTREFGVMMAIGTSRKEVMGMVVIETLLLSTVGVVIGNILAVSLTAYFHSNGFDLKWLTSANLVIDGAIVQTVSYPTIQWMNSLVVTSLILLLAVFASFIPSRHISKLSPVKALRSL
jgi:putative ABC transport system permease protein